MYKYYNLVVSLLTFYIGDFGNIPLLIKIHFNIAEILYFVIRHSYQVYIGFDYLWLQSCDYHKALITTNICILQEHDPTAKMPRQLV